MTSYQAQLEKVNKMAKRREEQVKKAHHEEMEKVGVFHILWNFITFLNLMFRMVFGKMWKEIIIQYVNV